jgi:toxin ParE1/3/4
VSGFRLEPAALQRLDEIADYTKDRWGREQAERYSRQLFACFRDIAERRVAWRNIPPEFGVEGYFCRCQHHHIYWKVHEGGDIAISSILHERMHQAARITRDASA